MSQPEYLPSRRIPVARVLPAVKRRHSAMESATSADVPAPVVSLDAMRQRKLMTSHAGLVERQVRKTMSRVGFCCEEDEIRSAAWIGFLEAVRRFEAARGVPFEAFALPRIQGAILDELRSRDHLRRLSRQRARRVSSAQEQLTRKLNRSPTEHELARASGEDLETFRVRSARERAQAFVSLEGLPDQGREEALSAGDTSADDALSGQELRNALEEAVRELPERHRLIVVQYYEEDRSYREIGQVLGVSESRICQLLKGIHRSLRSQLAAHAA